MRIPTLRLIYMFDQTAGYSELGVFRLPEDGKR